MLRFQKARVTNAGNTSFAAKVPTLVRPSGDGVHYLHGGIPNFLHVIPYGTGDDNDVFEMRIILWNRIEDAGATLWMPSNLTASAFVCTLSAAVGIADGAVLATERFADTITSADTAINSQTLPVSIISPVGDVAAGIILSTLGAEMIEFLFDSTTGDPTGMNALFRAGAIR